jgi:hypothetical protein
MTVITLMSLFVAAKVGCNERGSVAEITEEQFLTRLMAVERK